MNIKLKFIIYSFLFAGGGIFCILLRPLNASSSRVFIEKVPILMYHYIEIPPATTTLPGLYLKPDIFESQLQEINRQKYKTVFMSEVARNLSHSEKMTSNTMALTFDDGYEDFYTKAFPLLQKYKIKSTVYIIINTLDKPGYLTTGQLKELARSGLVEIGSHTFNHPDLRKLKAKDVRFEILASRRILRQLSGQEVLTFAYPYGYYQPEFFHLLSSAGYLGALAVKPGAVQDSDNLWIIKRLRPGNQSGINFATWLEAWFH